MIKLISYFLFDIISYLDRIIFILFKRSFLIYFGDKLNSYLYINRKLNNFSINFYTPNSITRWRSNTFDLEEPQTIQWINKFHKQKKEIILWDIGSNIGLYSIYASIVHKNIKVICFEPSTSNLRVLSRNISINKLKNKISIFQIPLSEKTNTFSEMSESKFMEGWAMHTYGQKNNLVNKKKKVENEYKIFGTSINYILDNKILEIPNYIKLDVDGLEYLILLGGKKYLSNKKIRSIIVEVDENYKHELKKIKKIMIENNFNFKEKHNLPHNDKKFQNIFNYVYER